MTENKPIDVAAEVQPQTQQAVVVREQGGAVGYALSIDELHRNLQFVRDVMKNEMREDQDYGKIPGTGEKPTLLQPGAQKLMLTFNLTEFVKREVFRDFPNLHREYEYTITVRSLNGKEWDGVGTCSTLEAKYRYRKAERKCPACGKHTIIQGKEEYGGGWVCFKKKGGCGAKFQHNDQAIQAQSVGRVEHDNPPDYWNTVRKMAFKRALVHAAINATNTSELWTQDLEEMPLESDESPQPKASKAPQAEPTQDDWNAAKPQARQATPSKPVSAPANGNVKATPLATEEQKAKLLDVLKPQKELAERYFRAIDWLFPTEPLEALDLIYVPSTKKQFDLLVAQLDAVSRGEIAVAPYPPAERALDKPKAKSAETKEAPQEVAPTIDPSWQIAEGRVESVNLKEGKKKDGTGWSLWGIKVGGEWHNSFSNRIGHFARDAYHAKQSVKLYYSLDKENCREAMEIV